MDEYATCMEDIMRFYLLLGGFIGFLLTFVTELMAEAELSVALRDGAIGCLIVALLFRWLHSVLIGSYRVAAIEKAKEMQEQSSAEPTPAAGAYPGSRNAI